MYTQCETLPTHCNGGCSTGSTWTCGAVFGLQVESGSQGPQGQGRRQTVKLAILIGDNVNDTDI